MSLSHRFFFALGAVISVQILVGATCTATFLHDTPSHSTFSQHETVRYDFVAETVVIITIEHGILGIVLRVELLHPVWLVLQRYHSVDPAVDRLVLYVGPIRGV